MQLWSVATGTRLAAPLPHAEGAVDNVVFAPDGRTLLTLTSNGIVRLWDSEPDSQRVRVLPHPNIVWSAAFSEGGEALLTGCGANEVAPACATLGRA